jgi:hypothetical protein
MSPESAHSPAGKQDPHNETYHEHLRSSGQKLFRSIGLIHSISPHFEAEMLSFVCSVDFSISGC